MATRGEEDIARTGRRCGGCKVRKPLTDFTGDRSKKDGLSVYCKACMSEHNRRAAERRAARDGRTIKHRATVTAPDGMKYCPDCEVVLPLDLFVKNRSTRTGYGSYCRPCQNKRATASREKNGGNRRYHMRRRYAIDVDQFDELFAQQRGLCAICHIEAAEHVDHDHGTGAVRGLLCFTCNVGLGNFKDDPRRLLSAVDYLEGYMYFGGVGGTGAA